MNILNWLASEFKAEINYKYYQNIHIDTISFIHKQLYYIVKVEVIKINFSKEIETLNKKNMFAFFSCFQLSLPGITGLNFQKII